MIHAARDLARCARPLQAMTPLAVNLTIGTLLRLVLPYTLEDSGERYRYYAMSLFFPIRDCPSFHCFRVLPPLLTSLLPFEVIDSFLVTGFVFQVLAGAMLWLIAEHVHHSRRVATYATAFYWATWAPVQSFGDPLLITDPVAAFWSLTSLYLLLERRYILAVVVMVTGATVKEGILLIPAVYAVYVFLAKDQARRNLVRLATLVATPVIAWLLLRIVLSSWFGYVSHEDEAYVRATYFFGLWLPNLGLFPRNVLIAVLYIFGACGAAWILAPLGLRHANRRQVALTVATLPAMVFLALYQVPDRALASFPYATLVPAALVLTRLPAPISIALLIANAAFTIRMNTSVPWIPRIPILLATIGLLTAVAIWLDMRGRGGRSSPETPPMPSPYGRWIAWTAAAAIVVLVSAVSVRAWRTNARARMEQWDSRVPAIVADEANTRAFAVSPDGRSVVFVAMESRKEPGIATRRLWRRGIDESFATPIVGTELASAPFWSPDGSSLGFFAGGKLKTLNVASGTVGVLAAAPFGRGGAWSRRGVIVFAPDLTGAMHQVASSGGPVSPATTLDASRGEQSHRWPSFLPDGTHFIFHARGARPADSALYVGEASSSGRQLVTAGRGNAVYAGPGFLLIGGDDGLWMQPFDLARLRLFSYPTKLAGVDFTDATSRAAFAASDDVLVYADKDGARVHDRPNRLHWVDALGRLLGDADADAATAAALSRDHAITHHQTSDERIVTSRSPDGRVVLFQARAPVSPKTPFGRRPWKAWIQHLARTSEPVPLAPLTPTAGNHVHAQFSPDGRWIAYTSDESGADEVYLQPFPQTGETWQVSVDGGAQPRWRGTHEIVYVAADRFVRSASIETQPALRAGRPRPLFEIGLRPQDPDTRLFEYAVTPDGSRFLMNLADPPGESAPVVVVSGWKSGQISR